MLDGSPVTKSKVTLVQEQIDISKDFNKPLYQFLESLICLQI